jgi:hypothetical protein
MDSSSWEKKMETGLNEARDETVSLNERLEEEEKLLETLALDFQTAEKCLQETEEMWKKSQTKLRTKLILNLMDTREELENDSRELQDLLFAWVLAPSAADELLLGSFGSQKLKSTALSTAFTPRGGRPPSSSFASPYPPRPGSGSLYSQPTTSPRTSNSPRYASTVLKES